MNLTSFVARQPNGLLCRFSTVVGTITHHNMTDKEYIEMCAEKAREDAESTLKNFIKPFDEVKERFVGGLMTQEEFNKLLLEMGDESVREQNCTENKFCDGCRYYQDKNNTYICTNEQSKLFNKNPAPFQTCRYFSEDKKYEELRQYRSIGTVEEVYQIKRDLDTQIKHSDKIAEVLKSTQNILSKREVLLKEYSAIGTIHECQEAAEMRKVKKPERKIQDIDLKIGNVTFKAGTTTYWCSTCKKPITGSDSYCRWCGQAISWQDDKREYYGD